MENTEAEDNFNAWVDIVKKNHPDVKLTEELMDILFDTFAAGAVTVYLDGPIDVTVVQPDSRLH